MKQIEHCEQADWPTACTPQAAKAPAVGGPSAVAGLGGAPRYSLAYNGADGTPAEKIVYGLEGLLGGLLLTLALADYVLVEVAK